MLSRQSICRLGVALSLCLSYGASSRAAESLWIEAEHLHGVQGYCWPMGQPGMQQTNGHWGLSGPGWAAEWNQGGESGFLSIATGPGDAQANVALDVEVPVAGDYALWVRYGDWREQSERFEVVLEQSDQNAWTGAFGAEPAVDEDNEAKLYWGWAFVWARHVCRLQAGTARVTLRSTLPETVCRQVDVLLLTTDLDFVPRIKSRPHRADWQVLAELRGGAAHELEPLARRTLDGSLPATWPVRTFHDRGFLYLWNTSESGPRGDWLMSDEPGRVLYPWNAVDDATIQAFVAKYGGQAEVPIFSDPRVVPTFHGVGPAIFRDDPATGHMQEAGRRFAAWLDAHPERCWATMMNYHPGAPVGAEGVGQFEKYRDRYVGSIAGESLGYFYPTPESIRQATAAAQTRRQLVEALTPLLMAGNAEKYRLIYGRDYDPNPYADVIPCLSVGNIVFNPLAAQWGARTLGYESAAATATILSMRWAFMRGLARQWDRSTATYRSSNFGDSATIFSNSGSYHTPQNIFDNYYSVYSGAGMTWYKMDLWYQYMAGSSMFYHEQGFDEFWLPGGTTAAGLKEVQLSPKGKLVDRFLRVTAQEPERGTPYTPLALLVDYAHGWEPSPYWPNSFKNIHEQPDRFLYGDHERMLEEYFWTAFYPIGPESEKPLTGTNEVFVPGVFGDVFDVVCAYPDPAAWRTIDTYPVLIAAGEIELTQAEGERLAQYIAAGGTLLVADGQLTGPGAAALPAVELGAEKTADGYRWLDDDQLQPAQRFRYRPITTPATLPLATTSAGDVCCAAFDHGAGRLIYLSVPRGLGIDRRAVPLVPRLFAHLVAGQMPISVRGDVQWLLNRDSQGWQVTLLNPAGQLKPQQGILPTDYRENRPVTIRSRVPLTAARDRLLPSDRLTVQPVGDLWEVSLEVPAGSVRIVELR